MRKKTIIFLSLLFAFVLNAQPPLKFYCRYGGNGYDFGYDVKQTFDGGYIVVGSTSSFGQGNTDLYLLKLDSMGQVKYQKSFGGYNNEIGKSIVQLADSSFVITGYTSSSGVGGYDMYLLKTDALGNLIWQKTIGGVDWDFSYNIKATTDGGFIICGTTYSYGYGNADGYVVKVDANGNTIWSKYFGGANDDEFKSVTQTSDGNYALTGYTKSYNDVDSGDVWIFKIDMNGDSLWSKYYGGSKEDFGRSIIELNSTDLYVAGGTASQSVNNNLQSLQITFNSNTGNQTYLFIDATPQEKYYNAVVQGVNGFIANCGKTKKTGFGYDGLIDVYKEAFWYFNFMSHGSTGREELFGIDKTKDKGFVAVGVTNGFGSVLDDVFIMKGDSAANKGSSIVGVNELEKTKIDYLIYPNPTTDYVYINILNVNEIKEPKYQIINISGQVILSGNIYEQKTKLNVTNLSEGLYFLNVYNSKSQSSAIKFSVIK